MTEGVSTNVHVAEVVHGLQVNTSLSSKPIDQCIVNVDVPDVTFFECDEGCKIEPEVFFIGDKPGKGRGGAPVALPPTAHGAASSADSYLEHTERCGESIREQLAETSRSAEIPLGAVSEIVTRLLEQQLALQEAAARKLEARILEQVESIARRVETRLELLTQNSPFRAELASQSGEHKEFFAGHLESHRQEHSAALHGVRAELEAQLAQQFAAVSALALRQAAQEDVAAAQLER